ncbi:unnamed protein product, partial [Adineta steineri]
MDILIPYLNHDGLLQYISTSMSNILNYQNDLIKQEKEIDELSRLLDALPVDLQLNSIPIACQLFDYFLQNSSSIVHYQVWLQEYCLYVEDDLLFSLNLNMKIINDNE